MPFNNKDTAMFKYWFYNSQLLILLKNDKFCLIVYKTFNVYF